MLRRLQSIGPGALTAAAFIGPGTVTTATLAGARFGYALVWTLIFATIAAIILQEMAARIGVVGRRGLGEAVIDALRSSPSIKWAAIALIISALFVGNAAYEGGNIAGAALGLEAIFDGAADRRLFSIAIAVAAGAILLFGGYNFIEKFLIGVVVIMTLAFAAALTVVGPDWGALFAGARPSIPIDAAPIAIGLIGTTIVPYNLFLHAAAARRRWAASDAISDARFDATVSIGLGGIISILVLSTAAASLFGTGLEIASAGDMARQLEPAFGAAAKYAISAGLIAAGLSSAITAPLATGFAAAELFGFESNPTSAKFRLFAGAVLLVGALVAIAGAKPVEVILFAQIANGLLLPIIAVFLLITANRRKILGGHVNRIGANLAGGFIVLVTTAIGARAVLRAFGVF